MAIAMPKTVQPPVKGGPPEHLIYASTAEEKLLKALGGAGIPTKSGVPSYENLYGLASPSQTKSYYSAPSNNQGPTGGLGSNYSSGSGYSTGAGSVSNASSGGGYSGGHSSNQGPTAGQGSNYSGSSGYSTVSKSSSTSPTSSVSRSQDNNAPASTNARPQATQIKSNLAPIANPNYVTVADVPDVPYNSGPHPQPMGFASMASPADLAASYAAYRSPPGQAQSSVPPGASSWLGDSTKAQPVDMKSAYADYRPVPSYTYNQETGGQFTPINQNFKPGQSGYLKPMSQAMAGVDPSLTESLREAALNSGMSVHPISEFRAYTPANPSSLHGKGMATDVSIADANGKLIPNYQNGPAFGTYEKYAQAVKQAADQNGIGNDIRWGGYFSGAPGKYGAADLMHFDTGGKLGYPMAGGSFANGLTQQQASLYPGAQSHGMGASTTQVASASPNDLPNTATPNGQIAPANGPSSPLIGMDTNSPAYQTAYNQTGETNNNSFPVEAVKFAQNFPIGKIGVAAARGITQLTGGMYGNQFTPQGGGQPMQMADRFGTGQGGTSAQMPIATATAKNAAQTAPTVAALTQELATSTDPIRRSQIIALLNQLDPSTIQYGLQMRQNA